MARVRAIFFFKDSAGYGWSEMLWSTLTELAPTMAAAKRLLRPRVALLGRNASLEFIRVSDEEVKRDSLVYPVPPGDQVLRGTSEDQHDSANLALIVRMDATNPTARRTLYMRGFKDLYAKAGKFDPDGLFISRFRTWEAALKADSWGIKLRNPLAPIQTITNIAQVAGAAQLTITTAANHGFLAGEAVTFNGVRGTNVPKGTYKVFAVPSATTFQIVSDQLLGAVTSNGTVRRTEYTITGITSAQVMRLSHRIAGRPFDAPVGRRPARSRT